jgi:hypothetical protein
MDRIATPIAGCAARRPRLTAGVELVCLLKTGFPAAIFEERVLPSTHGSARQRRRSLRIEGAHLQFLDVQADLLHRGHPLSGVMRGAADCPRVSGERTIPLSLRDAFHFSIAKPASRRTPFAAVNDCRSGDPGGSATIPMTAGPEIAGPRNESRCGALPGPDRPVSTRSSTPPPRRRNPRGQSGTAARRRGSSRSAHGRCAPPRHRRAPACRPAP